jgi:hypothetical protein
VRTAFLIVICTAVGLSSCAGPPVFVESGSGNGSSDPFHLNPDVYTIEYTAVDREPYFGCTFGVALETPVGNPLAPGRVIATTPIDTVDPNGSIHGRLITPSIPNAEYSRYLGNRPCDWTVRITR